MDVVRWLEQFTERRHVADAPRLLAQARMLAVKGMHAGGDYAGAARVARRLIESGGEGDTNIYYVTELARLYRSLGIPTLARRYFELAATLPTKDEDRTAYSRNAAAKLPRQ